MGMTVHQPEHCWFVIAAHNEASVIGSVVEEIRAAGFPVVVVDDGSRDGTGAEARAHGAVVCVHCVNLGQGAALQTGISFALAQGSEYIVTFDADGQHRLQDAVSMLEHVQTEDVDVLYGSRFLNGSANSVPWFRRLVLRAGIIFTRVTARLKVTDVHCGLRVFTHDCAQKLNIQQNRMAHASEIPSQLQRQGLRSAEWPVTIDYTDYSKAKGQRSSGALLIVLDLMRGGSSR